mgnify:CR=1 FL=1
MTRSYQVPMLIAVQYNRQAADGQPQMSDIKDSGQIEQDADLIISLWEKQEAQPGSSKQIIQYDILKNRNGAKLINGTKSYALLFDKTSLTFSEMSNLAA